MDVHLVLRAGNNYLINLIFFFTIILFSFHILPFWQFCFVRLHFWLHNYNMEILLSLFNNHSSKIFETFLTEVHITIFLKYS